MGWFETFTRTFFDLEAMAATLPQMLLVGLKNTLLLSFLSTLIGTAIGIVLAILGVSPFKLPRYIARIYTDMFRGMPAIVTILIVGQGLATLARPVFGMSPYPLAILALSLISGAYIGEIFRAGILSVERGQMEACRALSMRHSQAMRLIIVPQGVRRVLPALVNQFIGNVKDSSLVYLLGLLPSEREVFLIGQDFAINTGNLSPLVLAGFIYMAITVPLTHLVNVIDSSFRLRKPTNEPQSGLQEAVELEQFKAASETVPAADLTGGYSGYGGIEIRGLDVYYGDYRALSDVNLTIKPGTVTCLIGASGSGKSTLLRCLNRLAEPRAGVIELDGIDVHQISPEELRARVGMVFQNFNLFPDHTALENVALAPEKVKGMPREEARRIAAERLTEVGLQNRLGHRPRDLSGGQQQRVAIARALAMTPEVMLFDEVTSALDPELVKGILNLMASLAEKGMTMVIVTHEMNFARQVADQVVYMDEGRIIEVGAPSQIFEAPASERLRQFLAQVI
ncbi:amino acid ABC transporter permease/ATP-binding protein [Rhizobium sp. GN54]|uniref:amino acid ABC transporter permease/ATP-binding protein n=1 Tax=Rhizobium sp. GN54 TaxID=2898150 RepID=UPI001E56C92E|nr:amino acid ABC transporter permease/ATP-binding protein [Rhizobium sp. GN54]MCD2184751.1 amino acid ABC transporter permease/ATP-binding protein [Rhizobium sp. GN54]